MHILESVAFKAVDLAASIMTGSAPSEVTPKGDRDMVSDLDITIQRVVRTYLQGETPEIAFLGEEGEPAKVDLKGPVWVLDPVDGTANMIRQIPICGISLALISNHQPVLGVVDLPFLRSRYYAYQGEGAFHLSNRLKVSTTHRMADAMVTLGDYAVGANASQHNQLRLSVSRRLASEALRVRMLGSAATDLVWLADGKTDISITLSNNPWDVAAGVIIAREAGALVMDIDGSPYSTSSKATIATTPLLQDALLAVIRTSVNETTDR
jgi:myo-inositol-1(or 4)-monophosphatase